LLPGTTASFTQKESIGSGTDMFWKLKSILLLAAVAACVMPVRSADEAPGKVLGGTVNSPVRIEVFSDFQCPGCRDLYLGTIRQVLQEYSTKDKVCIIYHEFPLDSIHQHAREAARYAEAASRLGQDKLLAVMDSLFTDQAQWAQDGSLESSVSKALPRDDFQKLKKMLQDPSINSDIEKEVQLGLKREVKSTPTLFVHYVGKEQKAEGVVTYPVLKQFIDQVIK
jgi:protein-disulfide isomerase